MYLTLEKASDLQMPKCKIFLTESAAMAEFNNSQHSDKCQWILWGFTEPTDGYINIQGYRGPR